LAHQRRYASVYDASVKVGQGDGLAAWMADAAMQRILDHHGADDLV
jgi:hypothetical protein